MGPDASLTPELIQAQSFTNGFRGYDAAEVRAFLTRVATELRAWRERAEGLESAWHSAEERAARPPVLDEDTLMAAVGEETAAILRTARAAAADMRTKAVEEAERALSEARSEAERLLAEAQEEAQRTVTDARGEATRLRMEADTALTAAAEAARAEAAELLEEARRGAAEILERAAGDAEEMRAQAEKDRQLTIEGVTTTRDRILEDLSRRRRVATVQIEQLRAGRERLIESYAIVRRTLEEVQSELSRADAEARAAADDVGRRLKDDPHVELTEASRAMTEPLPPVAEADPADPADPAAAADEVPAADHAAQGDPAAEGDQVAAAEKEADGAGPAGDGERAPVAAIPPVEETAAETDGVENADEPGSDVEGDAGGSAVDELFARIRATRTPVGGDAVADEAQPAAQPAPAEPAPAEARPEEEPAEETPPAGEVAGRKGPRRRRGSDPAPVAVAAAHPAGSDHHHGGTPARATVRLIEPPAPGGEPTVASDTDSDEAPVPDGDEALLQARELSIVQLELNLTRRLKRALQDEQNDVLDRLRNLKETADAARLLPDEADQVARYSTAAGALVGEAASAGAVFADETLGVPGRDAPVEVDVADLAAECGTGIVAPLRRRLEQAIETGAGEDQAVLVETIGAAYREWKTQRIERLAGDVLSAAFSRGTWEAAPAGARLRWVVEDVDGPCPDCDDDALAGDIPKGDEFPTGQKHPPAHSGCRCLLVPSLPAS